MGNKERLKIIESLKRQDHCVCELEVILDKSQPTISHHLRELEKIGIIRGWKKGKFTHYDIVDEKMEYYLNLMRSHFKENGKSSN
jgi:ArsR family transcriptional regulator